MNPRRLSVSCSSLFVLAAAGCARALREPPSLSELAHQDAAHAPAEVDPLLAEAEALFARRDLGSVRQAVVKWLAAAAADEARIEGLLGAASGKVWLAEHEPEPGARVDAATTAVQTSQLCLRTRPDSAACSYWLGAALGLQARERPTTGLSALPKIIEAFERAAASDPLLEEAGPDRALALVYLRAPGWPRGPGDPDRGLEHARRAAERKPEYPPNLLALAEALVATEQVEAGREEYGRAEALAGKRVAAGDLDAPEWLDEARSAMRRLPKE